MTFTHLIAWQKGLELTEEVYAITKYFPSEERFGITSQIRRASVGILANLAEGYSRSGSADKSYKYTISRGECAEVHALILVSVRLKHLSGEDARKAIALCLETGRLLTGLVQAYRQNE